MFNLYTYFPEPLDKTIDKILFPFNYILHETLNLSPNAVSVLGLFSGILSIGCILLESWELALFLMAFSLFFDILDGNIARTYDLEGENGEIIELIVDRSIEIMMFLALAYVQVIDILLAVLIIYAIILMTSLRDKAKFDPGAKRIAFFIGYILGFPLIITIAFFIQIFAYMLQLVILDIALYKDLSSEETKNLLP